MLISLFLFGGVSSSSGCLRQAALFYSGTQLAFHVTIFMSGRFKKNIVILFAAITFHYSELYINLNCAEHLCEVKVY